jgi:hypothetical protein
MCPSPLLRHSLLFCFSSFSFVLHFLVAFTLRFLCFSIALFPSS